MFRIIDYDHPDRPQLERLVQDSYSVAYGATLKHFPKTMVASYDASDGMDAACGVRRADDGFFAQYYMDEALEDVASESFNRNINVADIMEFTTLSCKRPGASLRLISEIVSMGEQWGLQIAVFTATRPLRKLLCRAGVPMIEVCPAPAFRVPTPSNWGRYYDTDPWVCMVDDGSDTPRQLYAPVFNATHSAPGVLHA